MTTYTLADASQPAIVRRALESALVSGDPMPVVRFGGGIEARLSSVGLWQINARPGFDIWAHPGHFVTVSSALTTEQAVAAVVAARTGRN